MVKITLGITAMIVIALTITVTVRGAVVVPSSEQSAGWRDPASRASLLYTQPRRTALPRRVPQRFRNQVRKSPPEAMKPEV